jgi:hypothetical protein
MDRSNYLFGIVLGAARTCAPAPNCFLMAVPDEPMARDAGISIDVMAAGTNGSR